MRFILTAMPERQANVDYLMRHIPNLHIVWDEKRDAMDTFRRAWKVHQDVGTIRIQDDILLTKDFCRKVEEAVSQRPDKVIQFFSRSKKDLVEGSRSKNGGSWMMNQCYYLPPHAATRLTLYADSWEGYAENPTADDLLMADWLRAEKQNYWLHCPSLVEHMRMVSLIDKRRSRFRQSTSFCEPEYRGIGGL